MHTNTEATRIRTLHRKPAVLNAMGWSNSTHHVKIKEGLFVKPVKLGEMTSVYPDDEVRKLQDAYISGKSAQEIRALVAQLHAARKAAS